MGLSVAWLYCGAFVFISYQVEKSWTVAFLAIFTVLDGSGEALVG